MLRIYSIERRQKWGEKRKEDRIGDEGSGRGTGKTMNTKGNNEPSNQVFHKTTTVFPSYILRFIEIERRDVTVKKVWKRKRRLSGGCDSDNTSSERLLNGVFFAG